MNYMAAEPINTALLFLLPDNCNPFSIFMSCIVNWINVSAFLEEENQACDSFESYPEARRPYLQGFQTVSST